MIAATAAAVIFRAAPPAATVVTHTTSSCAGTYRAGRAGGDAACLFESTRHELQHSVLSRRVAHAATPTITVADPGLNIIEFDLNTFSAGAPTPFLLDGATRIPLSQPDPAVPVFSLDVSNGPFTAGQVVSFGVQDANGRLVSFFFDGSATLEASFTLAGALPAATTPTASTPHVWHRS